MEIIYLKEKKKKKLNGKEERVRKKNIHTLHTDLHGKFDSYRREFNIVKHHLFPLISVAEYKQCMSGCIDDRV